MKGVILVLLAALALQKTLYQDVSLGALRRAENVGGRYNVYKYTAHLDNFDLQEDRTFEMRVFFNDTFWERNATYAGPVLIYTGNEGALEGYWRSTGFMNDYLVKKVKGMLIYLEHRYFGESLPFGDASYERKNIKFLSAAQAMHDYASFLQDLKIQNFQELRQAAFIAFGGSYGGMLSSWFRAKYPFVVDGAIAASAPVRFYTNYTSDFAFNQVVTKDFARITDKCTWLIRQAFALLETVAEDKLQYDQMTRIFQTCKPVKTKEDAYNIQTWLLNAFQYLAMMDYPHASDFISKLPAWPVNASCHKILDAYIQPMPASILEHLLNAVKQGANVYYNSSGANTCNQLDQPYDYYNVYWYNASQKASGSQFNSFKGWNYLACTEEMMPVASNGNSDMFNSRPWNQTAYDEYCRLQYGTTPRLRYMLRYSGGVDMRDFKQFSNIVYSNGELDPWWPGGVVEDVSETVKAVFMKDSAHHLDLRGPRAGDPEDVVRGRALHEKFVKQWIAQKWAD